MFSYSSLLQTLVCAPGCNVLFPAALRYIEYAGGDLPSVRRNLPATQRFRYGQNMRIRPSAARHKLDQWYRAEVPTQQGAPTH